MDYISSFKNARPCLYCEAQMYTNHEIENMSCDRCNSKTIDPTSSLNKPNSICFQCGIQLYTNHECINLICDACLTTKCDNCGNILTSESELRNMTCDSCLRALF